MVLKSAHSLSEFATATQKNNTESNNMESLTLQVDGPITRSVYMYIRGGRGLINGKFLLFTVNSRYCGHSWDRDLVSVLPRVRKSGLRDKNILENAFMGRVLFVLTVLPTRAIVFARIKSIVIYT